MVNESMPPLFYQLLFS